MIEDKEKTPYPWTTEIFAREIARNEAIDEIRGKANRDSEHPAKVEREVPLADSESDTELQDQPPDPEGNENTGEMIYGEVSPFVNTDEERNANQDDSEPLDQEEYGDRRQGIFTLFWGNTYFRVLAAFLISLLIGLVGFNMFREPGSDVLIQTPTVPALDDTPGGSVQKDSPEYRETLITFNDQEADQAELQDRSFVATTESIPESLENPIEVTEPQLPDGESVLEPVVASEQIGNVPVENPSLNQLEAGEGREDETELAPYATSYFYQEGFQTPEFDALPGSNPMLETLRELTEIPVPVMRSGRFGNSSQDNRPDSGNGPIPSFPSGSPVSFQQLLPDTGQPSSPDHPLGLLPPLTEEGNLPSASNVPEGLFATATPASQYSGTALLPAGSVLYAQMVNGLNSDLPGPAVAEIIEGPLEGSRIIGQFTPDLSSGGLALQFDTLALGDGSTQPVVAYGLSPWTGENLTRSVLRPRVLQRYGSTMLLSFLSGASALLLEDGRRIVVANDAVYQEREARVTDRQVIAAGITSLATQIATDLQSQQPAGPQILLYPGASVAVLFATSVQNTAQK